MIKRNLTTTKWGLNQQYMNEWPMKLYQIVTYEILSLQMKSKYVLRTITVWGLAVMILLSEVNAQYRPRYTRCYPWRLGTEWRCGKRDMADDAIVVKNISDRRVSFKVGEWESICGSIGHKYAAHEVSLAPKQSITYKFKNAYVNQLSQTLIGSFLRYVAGKCNSFYVYDCDVGFCTDLLDVYPAKL